MYFDIFLIKMVNKSFVNITNLGDARRSSCVSILVDHFIDIVIIIVVVIIVVIAFIVTWS